MYILSNVSKGKLNLLRESVKDKSQMGSIKKNLFIHQLQQGICDVVWYLEYFSKENLQDVQSR